MPYIYRVSRRVIPSNRRPAVAVVPVPAAAGAAVSYRALQAEAKALGISGKQKAGKLKKAIAEAKRNG